jgi:hypothetical protein
VTVALDPSLPISNVKASVETAALGYDRTFELFGQTATVALVVPYLYGDLSGDVGTEGREITRQGLGDVGLRFTYNFIGNPAMRPVEFAQREPTTTVGVNVALVVPTGVYNSEHLINVGSNRWALRPEIGFSHPIGGWFVEGSAGVWIFTDNPDFYEGHVRVQGPLWTFQAHAGYQFAPGCGFQPTPTITWAAASALMESPETTINPLLDTG